MRYTRPETPTKRVTGLGQGHMTVFMWQEQIILALVKGEAYRGIPGLITKE